MKQWKIKAPAKGGWLSTGKQRGAEGGLGNWKMWRVSEGKTGKWETQGTAADNVPFHYLPLSLTQHTLALSPSSCTLLPLSVLLHFCSQCNALYNVQLHCTAGEGGDSLRPPCYALRKILQYSIHDTTLPIIHSHYIHCKMHKAQVYTIHLVLTKMLLKDSHNS